MARRSFLKDMHHFREVWQKAMKELDEQQAKLIEACPYETKLAIATFVFSAIDKHMKEGGSFRYLIYDRLGFNADAYAPLFRAGGMDISNMSNDHQASAVETAKGE